MDSNEAVYRVRHLGRVYRSGEVEIAALTDVGFDIGRGEFVVLLGASGSGKSTLLNLMGALDLPTSGEIVCAGIDIGHASEAVRTRFRREQVGFVFQFYNLISSLTAIENVALVTDLVAGRRDPAPLRPADALALVGLEARQNHFPAALSGGEQQRVAIARAIAKQPAVLLCDEPTGALDSATGIKVLEALTLVNSAVGATTLVITHNAAIRDIADRVIRFADGRIVEESVNAVKKAASEVSW